MYEDNKNKELESIKLTDIAKKNKKSKARFKGKLDIYYSIFSVLFAVGIICILLLTVSKLPRFGDAHNPAVNEVYKRYIEKGVEETGATNIVAGIILDYRAFDTFGEAVILFTGAISVITLLSDVEKVDRIK